jgi:ADP-L-glycero-D-manno-heptose 6-epimerase
MSIIVTGAAGFIGANLVKALNGRAITDIIAVDNLTQADKFINLTDCDITDYLDKQDFLARILARDWPDDIQAIFHQGACSDTMATDGRYVMDNNYRYSLALLDFCQEREIPLLYASSAAIYGGGRTFREDREHEAPLNVYGYSKYLFDQVVRARFPDLSAPVVGFRYFNVYGPREQHKGRMASVAFHHYNQYRASGQVKLFEGCDGYDHGAQQRDFVYIDDVVKVNLFCFDHPEISGIFNVGSGRAQCFNDIAFSTVNACRALEGHAPLTLQEMVEQHILLYIPFPEALKGKYQSFTRADISRLRAVGYTGEFASVEQGVGRYVRHLAASPAVGGSAG